MPRWYPNEKAPSVATRTAGRTRRMTPCSSEPAEETSSGPPAADSRSADACTRTRPRSAADEGPRFIVRPGGRVAAEARGARKVAAVRPRVVDPRRPGNARVRDALPWRSARALIAARIVASPTNALAFMSSTASRSARRRGGCHVVKRLQQARVLISNVLGTRRSDYEIVGARRARRFSAVVSSRTTGPIVLARHSAAHATRSARGGFPLGISPRIDTEARTPESRRARAARARRVGRTVRLVPSCWISRDCLAPSRVFDRGADRAG